MLLFFLFYLIELPKESRVHSVQHDATMDTAFATSEKLVCLHKPALGAAVQALLARNRRHATVRNVIAKLRQRGNLDAALWAEALQKHELAAVINTLWDVHGVIHGGSVGEPTIIPATLGWPPGSHGGDADTRRLGRPAAPWVRRSRVLVHTVAQCRDAVADLHTRPFVSVVVDASPQHDLGLIHIAALGDERRPARCYTFDVCATPRAEWTGAAHLFDSGRLARFLGDPAIPKAVCGSAPAHDGFAHALTRNLRRSPKPCVLAAAIQDREGGRALLLRNTIQVLPAADVDDDSARVIDVSMRAHMLDVDAWRAAGAAPRGDRWYWIRRPLSPRTLDNCAERAFALCVAYDALATAAATRTTNGGVLCSTAIGQPVTDSLLCIAAAQTAASTHWPDHARCQSHARVQDHGCNVGTALDDSTAHDLCATAEGNKRGDIGKCQCTDRGRRGTANTDVIAKDAHFAQTTTGTRCATATDTTPGVNDGDDGRGGAIDGGGDDYDDESDWNDLCRAMDVYASASAECYASVEGADSDNDDSNDGEEGGDEGDWYGDGRGTWATTECDFCEAP